MGCKSMKDCSIYGNKDGNKFKIRFYFDNEKEDYLERLCEELEKKNNVRLEDVERIYIKDIGGINNDNRK